MALNLSLLVSKVGTGEGGRTPAGFLSVLRLCVSDFTRWSSIRLREDERNAWLREERQRRPGAKQRTPHFTSSSHSDSTNSSPQGRAGTAFGGSHAWSPIFPATALCLNLLLSFQLTCRSSVLTLWLFPSCFPRSDLHPGQLVQPSNNFQ